MGIAGEGENKSRIRRLSISVEIAFTVFPNAYTKARYASRHDLAIRQKKLYFPLPSWAS
jgi:hypothetical protein